MKSSARISSDSSLRAALRVTGLIVLGIIILASCSTVTPPAPAATPTIQRQDRLAAPAATAAPPQPTEPAQARKQLVVCLPAEPASLYLYAEPDPAAAHILPALYGQDFVTLTYGVQALDLVRLPSLANGDATVRLVPVDAGDRVVDAEGNVITLSVGARVPTASAGIQTYNGSTLVMEQLVVDFVMQQRYWADGKPVTADDSVFSFELAISPQTPADKYALARTASYQATGNLSTRWTALPGFRDSAFATRFWQPAPRHLWRDIPVEDLLTAVVSSRRPVGDGPFRIVSWETGEQIAVERNPFYHRAAEGLPHLDEVIFRFVPDVDRRVSGLLSGACDLITREELGRDWVPFFMEAEDDGLLQALIRPGAERNELLLGVNSEQGYGDGLGRPDWFESQRFRQAIALCIDRQELVEVVAHEQSYISNSYLPAEHPLATVDLVRWPYDPVAGNRTLDELGYVDLDGDGIRNDPTTASALGMTLLVSQERSERAAATLIQQNLLGCGLTVELQPMSDDVRLEQSDTGPLYGRRFDLALFASAAGIIPDCDRFTSWQIPGSTGGTDIAWGTRSESINLTGWSSPSYDAICAAALRALPGTATHNSNHQQAQRIYADQLPSIPLFLNPQITAARPHILHLTNDPTAATDIWNLFAIDLQPGPE